MASQISTGLDQRMTTAPQARHRLLLRSGGGFNRRRGYTLLRHHLTWRLRMTRVATAELVSGGHGRPPSSRLSASLTAVSAFGCATLWVLAGSIISSCFDISRFLTVREFRLSLQLPAVLPSWIKRGDWASVPRSAPAFY